MIKNNYTPEQIDTLLVMWFRDHRKPAAHLDICAMMDVTATETALERVVWGVGTGYGKEDGKYRLAYNPTRLRASRAGRAWYPRETKLLRDGLEGAGQKRTPRVDNKFMARVLQRTPEEIQAKWVLMNPQGFGMARRQQPHTTSCVCDDALGESCPWCHPMGDGKGGYLPNDHDWGAPVDNDSGGYVQ